MHTLNPPLCVFDDGRVMSYGSMGGDGQPQFQAQVLTRILFGDGICAGFGPAAFATTRHGRRKRATLKVENRFDPSLVAQLEKAGHGIEVNAGYADSFWPCGRRCCGARTAKSKQITTRAPTAGGGFDPVRAASGFCRREFQTPPRSAACSAVDRIGRAEM